MTLSATARIGAAAVIAVAIAVSDGSCSRPAHAARNSSLMISSKKDFWLNPPDDWFMGDETQEQKGTHVLNTLPPPTGFTDDEIKATLQKIKLPPGFKIELWASGIPASPTNGVGKGWHALCRVIPDHQRLRGER